MLYSMPDSEGKVQVVIKDETFLLIRGFISKMEITTQPVGISDKFDKRESAYALRLSHQRKRPARMVPEMLCQAQLMAQGSTARGWAAKK